MVVSASIMRLGILESLDKKGALEDCPSKEAYRGRLVMREKERKMAILIQPPLRL
jgi:hypothetical protein